MQSIFKRFKRKRANIADLTAGDNVPSADKLDQKAQRDNVEAPELASTEEGDEKALINADVPPEEHNANIDADAPPEGGDENALINADAPPEGGDEKARLLRDIALIRRPIGRASRAFALHGNDVPACITNISMLPLPRDIQTLILGYMPLMWQMEAVYDVFRGPLNGLFYKVAPHRFTRDLNRLPVQADMVNVLINHYIDEYIDLLERPPTISKRCTKGVTLVRAVRRPRGRPGRHDVAAAPGLYFCRSNGNSCYLYDTLRDAANSTAKNRGLLNYFTCGTGKATYIEDVTLQKI